MKPSPFLMLLALLLAAWVWGPGAGRQLSEVLLRSSCGAAGCDAAGAVPGACEPSQEHQKVKPGSGSPWILAYVPLRSCHRVLKDKYGEFSPPAFHADFPINFWCNWTIWAGSRQHIIIYIQGFVRKERCSKNEDKILFEGVSSLVESSVVYACWKKEIHVFATFAQAVHIVLLKSYLPNCRDTQFKGKYYIFQDQDGESSSKDDMISGAPPPELPKQGSIFPSGWAESLRGVLGFAAPSSTVNLGKARVFSSELVQSRGILLGTMAGGSPAETVPQEPARMSLLETEVPCLLGSELPGGLRGCKEAEGRGTSEGIIPTAAQDAWGQSLSVSGDTTMGLGYVPKLSGVLLETPLLSALQVANPSLQPADVGLEKSQSVLHPTLRPEDLGDLQFTINPTQTGCLDLAACSSLSPGSRHSRESTDTTTSRGHSTDSLQRVEGHPQWSVPDDGLAMGLLPSLSSPYEVLRRDHSHLPLRSQRFQSTSEDLSLTRAELGTADLQHTKLMAISSPGCFRGALEGKTVLHPTRPWDSLQKHPHLCGQSTQVLQPAPTEPGSMLQSTQAEDFPAAEKAPAPSLGVKNCHLKSDRAAQAGLAVTPLLTGLGHAPTATSTPRTETIPALMASCTEPVLGDFGSTDFTPEAPPPPEVKPVSSSIVFSPPAALDLDPISFRPRAGTSPASPGGGQEMGSPSPPGHPSVASEPGANESPGRQKLVLGEAGAQQGETSAPVGSPARAPSPVSAAGPKPGLGIPQPEDHVSSDSGVAPSLPGREKHVVPVEHQGMAPRDKPTSASILGGFKMKNTTEDLQVGAGQQRNASSSATPAHPGPPVAQWGETVLRDQKPLESSDDPVPRNNQKPGGQQQKHAELGPPWAVEYFPIRSCHVVFRDGSGMFHLPPDADVKTNIWCNWTILAVSQKHIVIYIQGFQGSEGCGKNQDKLIFQGVLSSVETKVVYACHNRGTLTFAAQAAAVHVLFLSGSGSLSSDYGHFKGQYYVFRDSETVGSSDSTIAPQEPVHEASKQERWRMAVTKGLLPMVRASPGPSHALGGGRMQPEHVGPDEEAQHPSDFMEHAQSGANLSKPDPNECDQLQDEVELERSLKDPGTEDRETKADVLVTLSSTEQDVGHPAELSALEMAKGDVELMPALVTVAPCHSVAVPSSEVPSSSGGISAKSPSLEQANSSLKSEVVAAVHHKQTPVLEEPLLKMSTKPSYPAPGVTAGSMTSPGERNEELFDLVSALASLENDTELESQHHPGDVLLEVTIEIKPKDWIPRGGSELQKGLLEFMKNHIQENVKLSANRVSEIKLKEVRRTSDANLLLTFWFHLKPEERNVSLLLRSQLEELLGTSGGGVEKLQLVSLLVEDVNECSAGVNLCGEEAECFNGVGTYLCRCKKDYEDHSPTKSGTLCIHAPQSGILFLHHADMLVGAAIVAFLAMLVAAAAMYRTGSWRRHRRRSPSPEEPPVRAGEEPAMELRDLGECLRLDPFQLKLRARTPEWLWGARAHPGQAYRVFLEQSPPL